MADIRLNITAEDKASQPIKQVGTSAEEAAKGLDQMERSAGKTEASLTKAVAVGTLAAQAITKLATVMVDFTKSSIQAYLEQERADKQLSAALKQLGYDSEQLTATFKAQAAAFQETLGVSDDMVQGLQTLMIRFGVAPRDIQATTKAVLDYAAATGTDAESATMQLLKAVENGGKGLQRMGIHIDETGDKSKDLSAAVEALGKKFKGAAEADASSLSGQMNILSTQFGELKEGFGEWIAKVVQESGALQALAEYVGNVNAALFGTETDKQAARTENITEKRKKLDKLKVALAVKDRDIDTLTNDGADYALGSVLSETIGQANGLQREINALTLEIRGLEEASKKAGDAVAGIALGGAAPGLGGGGGGSGKSKLKNEHDQNDAHVEAFAKQQKMLAKQQEIVLDGEERANKELAKEQERAWKESEAAWKDHLREMERAAKESEEEMRRIGMAIGSSLGNAIGSQIRELGRGGQLDMGALLASVLKAAISFALAALGPFGALLAPILGGVIDATVGQAGQGFDDEEPAPRLPRGTVMPRAHSGAWAGDLPRFHEGGEVPAILQVGERVLSRREVARMGGQSGVDRMANGGGGAMNVFINATDARSFQDRLGGDLGTSFVRMFRQGRGEFAALLRHAKAGA